MLDGHDSDKGFRLVAFDGPVGKVTWASYAPGESYLVVTVGRLSRKRHVVPAGAVKGVKSREVRVSFSRDEIRQLPDLPHPEAPLASRSGGRSSAELTERRRSRTDLAVGCTTVRV